MSGMGTVWPPSLFLFHNFRPHVPEGSPVPEGFGHFQKHANSTIIFLLEPCSPSINQPCSTRHGHGNAIMVSSPHFLRFHIDFVNCHTISRSMLIVQSSFSSPSINQPCSTRHCQYGHGNAIMVSPPPFSSFPYRLRNDIWT